ncbi:MFS transporter [Sphingomonas sp. BK069]|uniref:MFS transporter n=1 Tax=Sphingomonas sp. BK069 TaxID=2586979 RepID=UPI00161B2144|nr:MFS transporter [Sphingomonas sp. BK069]MBB3348931.1 sugar phosphate permease [Sphingomonas sp. BK069]
MSGVPLAAAPVPASAGAPAAMRPTRVRHVVLWLTVLAYMITYMDRVVISVTGPMIQQEYGIGDRAWGWVLGVFQIGYALFQIPGGWLGDRFGPRRVLTAVVIWWSSFTALTTATWSIGSLIACRFLFGCGEAGAFPNATRSLSRWMLPAERGFAQGVTHAGARLGAALTPLLVVWLMIHLGWRAPFLIFAGLGLVWAAVWFGYYRDRPQDHAGTNAAEREMIAAALAPQAAAGATARVPWRRILAQPQLWLISAMYFCYAYSINIFLTWFPKYLGEVRDFELARMGLFASLPLMAGVVGDVAGGWVSDHLLRRTGRVTWARRAVAVVGFALAAVAIPAGVLSPSPLVSVAWFALAVFGLELTVGVSWALTLDVGGVYAGSVSAVMNTFGNIGGALAAVITGYILHWSGWNAAMYVLAALSALGGLLFLRIDASRLLYRGGG